MATLTNLMDFLLLGGPVLIILLLVSVFALALFGAKLLHFHRAGVGKHDAIEEAIKQIDRGHPSEISSNQGANSSHLSMILKLGANANDADEARERIEAEAERNFLKLESGMRFLDIVAQTAPLIGLFGTVLGMIEAFQALQGAGTQVDPSILAGGIWVALLTTAAGLAVAMPVSIGLAYLESQLDRDRALAHRLICALATPLPTDKLESKSDVSRAAVAAE